MSEQNTNKEVVEKLDEISKKLSVLLALTLRQFPEDQELSPDKKRRQGAGDRVRYFSEMGLDSKAIAEITGIPVTSVRTLLTPKRRK
ncbi:MAG: hypothetical protein WDZ90_01535 [Candidatus Paceibacterota bacterium]